MQWIGAKKELRHRKSRDKPYVSSGFLLETLDIAGKTHPESSELAETYDRKGEF
jgi:hypothetical protein